MYIYIPYWLFPLGYSLLAIPMPIRICLCACNGPRPCPAPMCGGRGAVRPRGRGGLKGPSTCE